MPAKSDRPRQQREVVLQAPRAVRLTPLETPTLAGINEPEASGRILLFQLTDETQRFKEVVAKTDIGQPGIFEIDAESEVVKFLARNPLLVGNACRKQCQTEASGRE